MKAQIKEIVHGYLEAIFSSNISETDGLIDDMINKIMPLFHPPQTASEEFRLKNPKLDFMNWVSSYSTINELIQDLTKESDISQIELRKHLLSFAFEHVFEDTKAIETMVDDYLTEQAHKLNY